MRKLISFCILILITSFSPTWAWVQSGNTTIDELVLWEGGEQGFAVLKLASGHNCYVPLIEKELYSLVLALHISGKTFNVHCHDEPVMVHGYSTHRLHRINVN